MHGAETKFWTQANAFPYTIFSCNQVGEAFADKGEADKGGDIDDRRFEKDVDEEL